MDLGADQGVGLPGHVHREAAAGSQAGDTASAHLVRESISGLRSARRAIIVCTHNLHEAEILADRIAIIRQGKIVANGSPEELKRSLLGDPIMELRLAGPLDGVLRLLPRELQILDKGTNWIRYQTAQPEALNPRIIQTVTQAGVSVITLSEVEYSLEDVYLRVVTGW